MTINTTKTMERTSTVLAEACEKTLEQMPRRMADAGCPQYETVKVLIPSLPGSRDDVLFVGLNGVGFYFLRGQTVDLPVPLARILRNAGELDMR